MKHVLLFEAQYVERISKIHPFKYLLSFEKDGGFGDHLGRFLVYSTMRLSNRD